MIDLELPKLKGKLVQDGDATYRYPEMEEIRAIIYPILKENGYSIEQKQSTRVQDGNTIVSVRTLLYEGEEKIDESHNECIVYKDSKLSNIQSVGATLTYIARMAIVFMLGIEVEVEENVKPTLKSYGKEFEQVIRELKSEDATIDDILNTYEIPESTMKKIKVMI